MIQCKDTAKLSIPSLVFHPAFVFLLLLKIAMHTVLTIAMSGSVGLATVVPYCWVVQGDLMVACVLYWPTKSIL